MIGNLTPPAERDFPCTRFEQRRHQLVSWIETERQAPSRRPAHPRRWVAGALAVSVAAAAVVLALTVFSPSSAGKYVHSLPRVSTSESGGREVAARVLLRAAQTAADRPISVPGPRDYIYTKTEAMWGEFDEGRDGPVASAFRTHTVESWIRTGGRGHYTDSEGHLIFPTQADADYINAHESSKLIDAHDTVQYFAPGPPNYETVSQLPTDPAQLKQAIESRTVEGGPPGDYETLQIIGDLLRWTGAPPAVRSALYTVASQLPGVVLLGPAQDQLGRPGTGVACDYHGMRYELIFDPETSGLLAEQTILLERSEANPFPPGSVIEWTAYIASGIVHSDTATVSDTP